MCIAGNFKGNFRNSFSNSCISAKYRNKVLINEKNIYSVLGVTSQCLEMYIWFCGPVSQLCKNVDIFTFHCFIRTCTKNAGLFQHKITK